MTFPISALDSPSLVMVSVVAFAMSTASLATRAASTAFFAISLIEADISSEPAATVCRLRETCSAAAETEFDWPAVSSAVALISVLREDNCWEEADKRLMIFAKDSMLSRNDPRSWRKPSPTCPMASVPETVTC